jgi:uncharacterized Zn finger protein
MKDGFYMPNQLKIVEDWLERFISIVDVNRLKRGKLLYNQGRVVQYAKNNNGFAAKVQGSGKLPYNIDADFSYDENGLPGLDDLYVECSCPDWVEYCKHSICAVLFFSGELNRELSKTEAVNKNDLPNQERLRKLTMASEHDILSLAPAPFWKHVPDLSFALRKTHKTVRKKLKDHRYTP